MANTQQAKEMDYSEPLTTEFSKEEITKLRQLIGSLEKSTGSGTCTLTSSGIFSFSHALNALNTTLSSVWIIDLGPQII